MSGGNEGEAKKMIREQADIYIGRFGTYPDAEQLIEYAKMVTIGEQPISSVIFFHPDHDEEITINLDTFKTYLARHLSDRGLKRSRGRPRKVQE